jgi:recombinational DNA repair ATPase RecF
MVNSQTPYLSPLIFVFPKETQSLRKNRAYRIDDNFQNVYQLRMTESELAELAENVAKHDTDLSDQLTDIAKLERLILCLLMENLFAYTSSTQRYTKEQEDAFSKVEELLRELRESQAYVSFVGGQGTDRKGPRTFYRSLLPEGKSSCSEDQR